MTASKQLWTPVADGLFTPINIFTGANLNGLGDNTGSVMSAEFSNDAGPITAMAHLHLDTNTVTYTDQSCVEVYVIPSSDFQSGSAYPPYTAGVGPVLAKGNYGPVIIDLFPGALVAATLDESSFPFLMPPGFFKVVLINQSGFAFPATALNTLKIIRASSENT